MKTQYGLFVGINYPGTSAQLTGCVNDARTWEAYLGPMTEQQTTLLDADATRKNILKLLGEYIGLLKSGDTLYFTFSGHGSWQPDANGDEPDDRDEVLCPVDYTRGMIVDDELDVLFSQRRRGSRIIFVSDSCHSGTVFRMAGDPMADDGGGGWRRARFLPPSEWMPRTKRKAAEEFAVRAAISPRGRTNAPKSGLIVLSGCKDTEYSYDAYIDGHACGAFTYNVTRAWDDLVGTVGHTYRDLWAALLKRLPSYEYPQTPRLNATTADARRTPFI